MAASFHSSYGSSFKSDLPVADIVSTYSIGSILDDDSSEAPLLSSPSNRLPQYDTIHIPQDTRSWRSIRWTRHRPLLAAALKCCAIFLLSCVILGVTLWLALPTIDEQDKPLLHIPKSFPELKDLNGLLKKYRDIYPLRIVVCYVIVYLFLQAFSLPGSMYLSILGGAVWGMPLAIVLACTCVATGASLCYLLSAAFGPALLSLPKWRLRLDSWSERVESQRSNLYSFMIILRIAPFPPHWVVNVLCPHLRIGLIPFWISTWFGILGVTIIHTAIGGGLDEMTSSEDFHLISLRNFLLLASIAFAVLIPVGLRHVLSRRIGVETLPGSPLRRCVDADDDLDGSIIADDDLAVETPAPTYFDSLKGIKVSPVPPPRLFPRVAVDMMDSEEDAIDDDSVMNTRAGSIAKGKRFVGT